MKNIKIIIYGLKGFLYSLKKSAAMNEESDFGK